MKKVGSSLAGSSRSPTLQSLLHSVDRCFLFPGSQTDRPVFGPRERATATHNRVATGEGRGTAAFVSHRITGGKSAEIPMPAVIPDPLTSAISLWKIINS